MELASSITDHRQWQTAYRQSLIWRDSSAFGEKTLEWFNRSLRGESDAPDALEILLTLASVPEHPWNATFLDSRLRKHSMPERDSRWTIPLHSLYALKQSAVHRLIDWGLTIKRRDPFDSDSVLRIAIALAWMFSSSNRYLRDRATKANANLLAGRESIAAELVRHFAEVNDLYVRERVLAVAYGVVMRSQDVDGVKLIADAVLDTVFATGDVVPHILLRDYARGVIERVNVLSPFPQETLKRVRPPYGSKWPGIPSKATIEKLESSYRANKRFGAGRIFSSVLHDDFGRYVIGTNSWSTDWLSLRLSQPEWRSYDAQISEIEQDLGPDERLLWDEWREAEKQLNDLSTPYIFKVLGRSMAEHEGEYPSNDELADSVASATRIVEQTRNSLARVLKQSVARKLEELWKTGRSQGNRAPKFDLHLIQRYVAKRVFDLGWTSERFDYFDSHVIGYGGREASKAERIGKKYQWLAYHEACALVADNFQYRPRSGRSEQNIPYEGPWQDSFRDIDPSHSIDRTGENAEDSAAWWTPSFEVDWGEGEDGQAWAEKTGDFPNPNDLLEVTDGDGKAWVLGDLSFERSRPVPDGLNSEEIESRKIWCNLTGFLVHTEDVGKFMEWAEGVDFWGRWMPESPSSHGMFLGEYLWSPASAYFEDEYYENGGWVTPDNECPVSIRPAAFVYHQASRGFDCSVESGFNLDLPSEDIVKTLSIQWTGHGSDFESVEGDLATMDPSANADGPSCLLIRRNQVDRLVEEGKLAMCWTILGEKQAYDFSAMEHRGSIHISGACTAQGAQVRGFMHFIRDRIGEREIEYKLETRRFRQ